MEQTADNNVIDFFAAKRKGKFFFTFDRPATLLIKKTAKKYQLKEEHLLDLAVQIYQYYVLLKTDDPEAILKMVDKHGKTLEIDKIAKKPLPSLGRFFLLYYDVLSSITSLINKQKLKIRFSIKNADLEEIKAAISNFSLYDKVEEPDKLAIFMLNAILFFVFLLKNSDSTIKLFATIDDEIIEELHCPLPR
jgi:hypothetical protein